jgi:hypothetical protein
LLYFSNLLPQGSSRSLRFSIRLGPYWHSIADRVNPHYWPMNSNDSSRSGSKRTVFIPPLHSIPDLPELPGFSDTGISGTTHTRSSIGSAFSSASSSTTPLLVRRRGQGMSRASDDAAIEGGRTGRACLNVGASSLEPHVMIAPSRSSSLRRTSSLADLDKEFKSILTDIEDAKSSSTRTASSVGNIGGYLSARSSTLASDDIDHDSKRDPTSTFYSMSEGSQTFSTPSTPRSQQPTTSYSTSGLGFGTGTRIVPSTLSLRSSASNSLLGDSHSGVSSSYASSQSSSSVSRGTGLARTKEVRRRTPRKTSRSVSISSVSSTKIPGESDKENDEGTQRSRSEAGEWKASDTSELSSLESRSYTSTSYQHTESVASIPKSEPSISKSVSSTSYSTAQPPPSESSTTSYATGLSPLPSTQYATVPTAPSSTQYETAEVCPSEQSTEYDTAECRCIPSIDSVSLTSTPSISEVQPTVMVESDVVSLYAPSTVPTIPSELDIARNIPLPAPDSEPSTSLLSLPSQSQKSLVPSPPKTSTPLLSLPSRSLIVLTPSPPKASTPLLSSPPESAGLVRSATPTSPKTVSPLLSLPPPQSICYRFPHSH